MTYKTLMVHIDLDRPNDARIKIAGALAERFGAGVLGVAVCRELPFTYSDGYAASAAIELERQNIGLRLKSAEADFRRSIDGHAKFVKWRGAITDPSDYIVEQARCADLLIFGAAHREINFDPVREVDPSNVLSFAGRPVLLVPHEVEHLAVKRVLIAWNDTREARRAVFDALPLLQLCDRVVVAEIPENDDPTAARAGIDEVTVWLARHGVCAHGLTPPRLESLGQQLDSLAWEEDADLIIAGGYSHSRLRESVFGGVTRELVMRTPRCVLLSH